MACNKRTVIELSSDSDDDNPLVNRRRKIRRRSQPQQNEADPEGIEHKVTDFLNFLDGALPRNLVACDVADYIQRESNVRLAIAREQGVPLDDVFIGRDCLPAWPQMQWDPEKESLHCAIQNQLLDLDVANVLGDALRGLLMDKGNRKLEEARKLGLGLEDITIGVGLLATWDCPAPEIQNAHGLENPSDHLMPPEELMDDDMGQSSVDSSIPHSLVFSRAATPDLDATAVSDLTSATDSASTASDSSSGYDSCSDFSSSSSSSEYSEISVDDEEDGDDTICMQNAVHPQPEYSESDDEAPHILHDVEVAGCYEGHPDIDLEVYVVEDDSDVDDLPELELAIDGDAFTYYFGDDGAVEVEIPGMDLRCSLDVPLDSGYDGDADMEDVHFEEGDDDDGDENSLFDEDEQMVGQEVDGANTQLNTGEASVPPVAQEDEEEPNSGIQVTEDGFMW